MVYPSPVSPAEAIDLLAGAAGGGDHEFWSCEVSLLDARIVDRTTGAGVDALAAGVEELLPAARADAGAPVAGTVFKVDRGEAGEKIAYVRLFSGTVRLRDRVPLGGDREGKVTAIRVFEDGADVPRRSVPAGRIGKLWGLGDVRIGDAVGAARPARSVPSPRRRSRPSSSRAAPRTAARSSSRSPGSPSRIR